ncbi:hypothetical protein O9K51_08940 [Purpureocillium lavendulum]|uniref:Uncharacterized protein n=1 Tax=Purpureocillium lavendulum TaxID=1247861 RepID=A0AB34FH90_9HYPO|nr:hypothetical protein O9K51_08940 [Purpureocillium lavendulum]
MVGWVPCSLALPRGQRRICVQETPSFISKVEPEIEIEIKRKQELEATEFGAMMLIGFAGVEGVHVTPTEGHRCIQRLRSVSKARDWGDGAFQLEMFSRSASAEDAAAAATAVGHGTYGSAVCNGQWPVDVQAALLSHPTRLAGTEHDAQQVAGQACSLYAMAAQTDPVLR